MNMINIIMGKKGTGKTKAIIESANATLDIAKGHVLFITDTSRYTYDLNNKIRYLDVTGFDVLGEGGWRGFIKGLVAANGDNEYIYLDGIARITGKPLAELENIFSSMEKLENDYAVKFVLTCSSSKEDLPAFILKYVD